MISNEIASDFDRIYIRISDVANIQQVLNSRDKGFGVLVCPNETRVSAIRRACPKFSHGVILTGNPIDAGAYQGSDGN